MRGKGVSKDKNHSMAGEQSSPNINCNRQCLCGTKTRLAQKHEMNQRMAEYMMAHEANSSRSESISTVTEEMYGLAENNYQEENVDELVDFIEGKSSGNEKKRMKKERQKQERIIAMRKEEEERNLQLKSVQAKKSLIEQYKEKMMNSNNANENLKPQMSKKQLKKAAAKTKKLMEEATKSNLPEQQSISNEHSGRKLSNPLASSPLSQLSQAPKNVNTPSNILSSLNDLRSELQSLSNPTMCVEDMQSKLQNFTMNCTNPIRDNHSNSNMFNSQNMTTNFELMQNLEQLRAKHKRELELLQLKHKQAIEEEELKSMHKQKEQLFLLKQKYGLSQPCSQPKQPMNQSATIANATNTSFLPSTTDKMNNSNVKPKKKKDNLTSDNSKNQIKISQNDNGGVDFTKVSGNQNEILSKYGLYADNSASEHMYSNSESKLFNQTKVCEEKEESLKELYERSNKHRNDESMVTIRRVDGHFNSSPTVTITQPIKSKDNKKVGDKLLYKVVNGEVLKASDAPNLIPGAKPMP